ncbi:MAG: hypothetical protein JO353_13050 [Phycisphaerae bacterium]|nr:hypothetical protein [Phycisphaerae bacterium]
MPYVWRELTTAEIILREFQSIANDPTAHRNDRDDAMRFLSILNPSRASDTPSATRSGIS